MRLRELGLRIGHYQAGKRNAISDVPGVRVGHVTVWRDEPDPPQGRGVARTGVTAVLPGPVETLFAEPTPAGTAVLNGAGELTGSIQVSEWGLIETPVYLTSTMAVGRVFDGAVAVALAADARVGVQNVVIPIVGECDDSWLNDARVVQVEAADAGRAVEKASHDVAEGAVGAGTGMIAFGWKAGIGTASRVLPDLHATVGVLVLANFGSARDLRIDGVPVYPSLGEGIERAARIGQLHRRRRDRRRATRRPTGTRGEAVRARARAHGIDRPSRQRRDLPGGLDRAARPRRGRRRAPARRGPEPVLRRHRRGDRGGRAERALGRSRHDRPAKPRRPGPAA